LALKYVKECGFGSKKQATREVDRKELERVARRDLKEERERERERDYLLG